MLPIDAANFGSMSTTPVIDTQLVSEVAALKALVSRLLNSAGGRGGPISDYSGILQRRTDLPRLLLRNAETG